MTGRTLMAALAAAVLLTGCQQPSSEPDARSRGSSEKYARDRDQCQAQVDDYMRSRRRIDDSAAETFRGDTDRAGRDGLATQMSNYGDSRTSEKYMANCLEARGWPQQQKAWWQRIGS
ncbi:MAG: hypothetical protein JSR24_13725 [Proteobacteria bacterium]|nr:hypothetical protein [Pseudomonadota bacterium]